jgi:hypothetical protein
MCPVSCQEHPCIMAHDPCPTNERPLARVAQVQCNIPPTPDPTEQERLLLKAASIEAGLPGHSSMATVECLLDSRGETVPWGLFQVVFPSLTGLVLAPIHHQGALRRCRTIHPLSVVPKGSDLRTPSLRPLPPSAHWEP